METIIGPSFEVFQGAPNVTKAWFSPDVAGYINEKIWHDCQKLQPQKDGSLIFEAGVAGAEEVKFWVMGWGSNAEVLEPAFLRDELRDETEMMLNKYRGDAIYEGEPIRR